MPRLSTSGRVASTRRFAVQASEILIKDDRNDYSLSRYPYKYSTGLDGEHRHNIGQNALADAAVDGSPS